MHSSDGWFAVVMAGDGRSSAVSVGDLLDQADAVVCLDLPRRTVMFRVIRRTLGRGLTRKVLWHDNRESLRNLLKRDPDHNIVLWSWHSWPRNRERWDALEGAGVGIVRLRSQRAVDRWLASLPRT